MTTKNNDLKTLDQFITEQYGEKGTEQFDNFEKGRSALRGQEN